MGGQREQYQHRDTNTGEEKSPRIVRTEECSFPLHTGINYHSSNFKHLTSDLLQMESKPEKIFVFIIAIWGSDVKFYEGSWVFLCVVLN